MNDIPKTTAKSPADTEDNYAFEATASFAQQRLWFLDQLEKRSTAYNVNFAIRLKGKLNEGCLEKALNSLVARHESLRTTFDTVDDIPVQVIAEEEIINLEIYDHNGSDLSNEQELLQTLADNYFDLKTGPLLRAHLIRIAAEENIFLLVIHHIICDAQSLQIIYGELAKLYEANLSREPADLPELTIQFADYAEWQQEWLSGEELKPQLEYWGNKLADCPDKLELHTDKPRPKVQSSAGAICSLELDASLSKELTRLAQSSATTLFNLMLTTFDVLMSRYTGADEVVVGTPISGRKRPELQNLIGFFINTIAMRADLSGEPTFREMLGRVKDDALDALTNDELPFDKLIEELQPDRDTSFSPIFQVMFVLHHGGKDETQFADLTAQHITVDSGTAKFDLVLFVTESAGGLSLILEYSSDLFEPETIQRMLVHYEALLRSIIANPDARLSELSMLDESERQTLAGWNDTAVSYPQDATLVSLFEDQVARTPDAIALRFDDEQLSYAELNTSANQLGQHLKKAGAGPETLIGICMERSIEMVVAIYGILKAGAAYVPLDPEYPPQRLQHMLEDADISLLLSQSHLAERLPEHHARVIDLGSDAEAALIAQHPTSNPGTSAQPSNAAYVIFTSGSTGRPKGVLNEHSGICNRLLWMQQEYGLDNSDRVLQKTPFSFDVSVWEFFWPLQTGATLVIAKPGGHRDAAYLTRLIQERKITTLHFVPSMLASFLQHPGASECSSLCRTICSGEALPVDLQRRFFDQLGAELHNLYGPTEAAIDVSYWACDTNDTSATVPIGRPVANTQLHIVDSHDELSPIGVPGELLIGGAQVARGYVSQPELTRERFPTDPFSADEAARVYRTGDLARYRADGVIEFLGRIDFQVKLRGFRIELGEIENALESLATVQQSVVLLREDEPDDKRLVAYITGDADPNDLRRQLKSLLPEYMLPAVIVPLDEIPLTPNGKIARQKLPIPEYSRDEAVTYQAPRNPTEETLANVWCEILGISKISIHDDFFSLGGHSLLATRLIAQARNVFDREIPLIEIFSNPTIAELAAVIDSISGTPTLTLIRKRDEPDHAPMSFAQQRLWFLDQLEPENPVYNLPLAVEIKGRVNTEALRGALNQLIERHEILRTCFESRDNQPLQIIATKATVDLAFTDASEMLDTAVKQHIHELIQQPFSLQCAPLFHATLLKRSDELSLLVLNTHHIISDGWSIGIMLHELGEFYTANCHGRPAELAKLPIQYADFSIWQHDWFVGDDLQRQLDYWRAELQDAPAAIDLPTDYARPMEQTYAGASLIKRFDHELMVGLETLARQHNCTFYMVILAVFDLLLARYSNTDEIVVGTPIAGRRISQLEGLIGFFSNTLALRGDLSGNPQFSEILRRIRKTTLNAYTHQDLPFEKLVEEIRPERDMSYSPIFQVMLVLQNTAIQPFSFDELDVRFFEFEMGIAKFDLLMEIAEETNGMRVGLQYNTDLFKASTIERMLSHYETLLRAVVANPEARLADLPLLDDAERKTVVQDFNATDTDFGTPLCVHRLVEAQADKTPDTVAVVLGDATLSYSELNRQANILGAHLRELGARSGSVVAVSLERSLALPVAALAVLKSGACYVPVDPHYPAERIAAMLEDSGALVVLSQSAVALPEHSGQRVDLDNFDFAGEAANLDGGDPGDTLYCIYTSGSTGKPKGVQLSHAGLGNLLHWQLNHPRLQAPAKTLQFASFSFDVHFQEFFGTWSNGGTIVMVDEELRQDLPQLAQFIDEQNIERLFLPYAALQPIAETLVATNATPALKDIVVAGEQLQVSPAVRALFPRLEDAALHNQYGPSETHVVTALTLTGNAHDWPALPSIGYPVANTRCYVLDQSGEPCPIGIPGELYLGGVQVALGYLNRPDLDADKFNASPFIDGERMYRTGDRVRFLQDGQLEFLGRADDQVKWRGFRIEPGEIEAQLTAQPTVQQAIVLLREDLPGDKRLVAYVTGNEPNNNQPDDNELKQALKDVLPDYMVPQVIVVLDELPLTPSGKVARRRLPVPEYARNETTPYEAPRNETEEMLTKLWADVLGINTDERPVGIHDNFFQLGGHSLLATQLVSRVRDRLGISLPLKYIFRYPSPAELGDMMSTLLDAVPADDPSDDEDYEEFSV